MYRLIIVGLGVASAALIAFGCGSSGGGETTAQVSSNQFMKEAKTVCAKTQKKFVVAAEESSANAADFSKRAASLVKQEAEELKAISGPDKAEAKLEPLIENMMKVSVNLARDGKKGLEDPGIAAYKGEAEKLDLGTC